MLWGSERGCGDGEMLIYTPGWGFDDTRLPHTLWVLEIGTGTPSGSWGSPSQAHPGSRIWDELDFLSFFLQKISNPGLAGALQIKQGEKNITASFPFPWVRLQLSQTLL